MDEVGSAKETIFFYRQAQIAICFEKMVKCGNKVFKGFYGSYMICWIQAVIPPGQEKNVDYLPGFLQFLGRQGFWC